MYGFISDGNGGGIGENGAGHGGRMFNPELGLGMGPGIYSENAAALVSQEGLEAVYRTGLRQEGLGDSAGISYVDRTGTQRQNGSNAGPWHQTAAKNAIPMNVTIWPPESYAVEREPDVGGMSISSLQHKCAAETELQNEAHRQMLLNIGGSNCKECGNHAKKDCMFARCRTCCKSRGFDCPTHVKSTWVPAVKRRERQILEASAVASGYLLPKSKRARSFQFVSADASESLGAIPASPGSSYGSDAQPSRSASNCKSPFPAEVKAHAIFKCIRVTGVLDGSDEYAYQATVKVGGHVFKGILYDHGLDNTKFLTSLSDLELGGSALLQA